MPRATWAAWANVDPVSTIGLMATFVFDSVSDASGSRYSAVSLDEQGRLKVEIHDVGGAYDEYQSVETYSAEQTDRLRKLLGTDIISGIAARFASGAELAAFAEEQGIGRGTVWNWVS